MVGAVGSDGEAGKVSFSATPQELARESQSRTGRMGCYWRQELIPGHFSVTRIL